MKTPLSISSGSIYAKVYRDHIVLELDEFCIEKSAKRIYHRLAEMLFSTECPEPGIQGAVELLRTFLEQEDFSTIRTANEELSGKHNVRVRISHDHSGKVQWSKV